ncbi:hypothetical protein EJB05_14677, partial [Eragrostis curvula]
MRLPALPDLIANLPSPDQGSTLVVQSNHMSSSRKFAPGSEKRRKNRNVKMIESIESQRGAVDRFNKKPEPSENPEELAIVVVEQQADGISQENMNISDDDNNVVIGHEKLRTLRSQIMKNRPVFSIDMDSIITVRRPE